MFMAHIRENQKKIILRIRKIKGQLEAVEKELENESQDCFKTLQTLTASRGAMNSLIKLLLEEHIKEHIMTNPQSPSSKRDKEALSLIQLIKSFWK